MDIVSKIPIKPLHQEVAGRIRELIFKGLLKTGDRIVETEMCSSLGISRTPFREALKILGSEGLVDLVPNKGAYVARPSANEIREMFEVMSILEGACARVAAERMTKSTFKKIESTHQILETHFEARDHGQYLAVNQTYHVMVQEMAGNKVLDEVINGLRQKILLYRHRQLYQADRFAASMQEHRDILEAFRRRDADAAESLMKVHLMNQCGAIVGLLDSRSSRPDSRE
jgi:DNA-binding GntR family transcriptional regulator